MARLADPFKQPGRVCRHRGGDEKGSGMFTNGQIAEHRQRKAVLLKQSEQLRRSLVIETQNLKKALEWADLGFKVARKALAGWGMVATLLASLRGSKQESSGFMSKIAKAVAFISPFVSFWKNKR